MSSLLYNELYKIFHKKGLYLITFITIGLFALVTILNTVLNTGATLNNVLVPTLEAQLDSYDVNIPEQATAYVEIKIEVDRYRLVLDKGYNYFSPEYYYIYNDYSDLIRNYYTEKYINKDEVKANELELKVKEAVASLDNFDWKSQIELQMQIIKADTDTSIDTELKQELLRALQYRIDNNIPISYTSASDTLDKYMSSITAYQTMNKDDGFYVNHDDLYAKKELEKFINETKYKIDNNLIKVVNDDIGTAQSNLLTIFSSTSIFLIMCILIVSAPSIAEEYNKGTIKQLLVKPYCRAKILISKILASFIAVMVYLLVVGLFYCLLSGILTNSFGSLLDPIVHYNFNTQSIVTNNTFVECFLQLLGTLPQIMILILFVYLMSILTGNTSASVVLGFVLTFSADLFMSLISKFSFLSYLPMFNWTLNDFYYGGIKMFKELTFTKAIIVDSVTIVGLLLLAIYVFKKKDIKNQ